MRTLAQEEDYVSLSLPSIERRSIMEAGMRPRTTRLDVVIVVLFLIAAVALLSYFLAPVVTKLVAEFPGLFRG